MKRALQSLVGMASIAFATPANACTPPPLPQAQPIRADESDADYASRIEKFGRKQTEKLVAQADAIGRAREEFALANAARVFLGRSVSRNRDTEMQGKWFQPVRWLVGRGGYGKFFLRPVEMDSCLYPGNGDALDSQRGDLIIFFIRKGKPGTRTIIDSIAVDRIRTQRLRKLVEG